MEDYKRGSNNNSSNPSQQGSLLIDFDDFVPTRAVPTNQQKPKTVELTDIFGNDPEVFSAGPKPKLQPPPNNSSNSLLDDIFGPMTATPTNRAVSSMRRLLTEEEVAAGKKIKEFFRNEVKPRLDSLRNQRDNLFQELFDSEKAYTKQLSEIVNIFATPMKSTRYLKPAEHQKLFSNVLQLESFHRLLLVKLSEKMEDIQTRQENISKLFIELTPQMEIYKDYINSYDANFLIAMMENHKKFCKYVLAAKSPDESTSGVNYLGGLLISPIQRIPRYELFLKKILECTPHYRKERQSLKNAYDVIHEVLVALDTSPNSKWLNETKIIDDDDEVPQKRERRGTLRKKKATRKKIDTGELGSGEISDNVSRSRSGSFSSAVSHEQDGVDNNNSTSKTKSSRIFKKSKKKKDKEIDHDEELSKDDESPMQWIVKMKKEKRSRLFTIKNQSTFSFDRAELRETKGRWRRKPPDIIFPNTAIQFGVEGKYGTSGSMSLSIEQYSDPIIFVWDDKNDQATADVIVPLCLKEIIEFDLSVKNRSQRFCDIVCEIKNIEETKSTDNTNESDPLSISPSAMDAIAQPEPSSDMLTENDDNKSQLSELSIKSGNDSDSSFDSSDDEADRRMSKFRGLKLQAPTDYKEASREALEDAARSLSMLSMPSVASTSSVSRRRRTTVRGAPNVFTPPTTPPVSSPENNKTNSIEPRPAKQTPPKPERKIVPTTQVLEKTREYMTDTFTKLEKGEFSDAFKLCSESLKLFVSLEQPNQKRKEALICANYKIALKILIAKQSESDKAKIAALTKILAYLKLQPKHRIICVRMAVKANMEAENYRDAAQLLRILLPLKLVDNKQHEEKLKVCEEHKFSNAFSSVNAISYETLKPLQAPYYQCAFCDATLEESQNICSFCEFGSLVVHTQKERPKKQTK